MGLELTIFGCVAPGFEGSEERLLCSQDLHRARRTLGQIRQRTLTKRILSKIPYARELDKKTVQEKRLAKGKQKHDL